MLFSYKARQGLDTVSEGVIEAPNREEAFGLLLQRGLHPFVLEAAAPPAAVVPRRSVGGAITGRMVYEFTRKLRTLSRAQVPLMQALQLLHEQTDHSRFKQLIADIHRAAKEGVSFSDALQRTPAVFAPLYVNLIRAGELSGRLDTALEALSDYLGNQEQLKVKLRTALAYPLLLLIVGVVSVGVLLTVVIPQLRPLLERAGTELPLATRIVLTASDISRQFTAVVIGAAVAAAVVARRGARSPRLRAALTAAAVTLPLLGRMQFSRDMLYLAQSLALLLQSGIPVVRALEVVQPGLVLARLRADIAAALTRVSNGQRLGRSLAESAAMPPFFVKMIAVGEEAGNLADVMTEIAQAYKEQIDADVALLSALLEPLMILGMGIVLGGMVMAVLLPIFELTQSMG